jgi:hypothetical protein
LKSIATVEKACQQTAGQLLKSNFRHFLFMQHYRSSANHRNGQNHTLSFQVMHFSVSDVAKIAEECTFPPELRSFSIASVMIDAFLNKK